MIITKYGIVWVSTVAAIFLTFLIGGAIELRKAARLHRETMQILEETNAILRGLRLGSGDLTRRK